MKKIQLIPFLCLAASACQPGLPQPYRQESPMKQVEDVQAEEYKALALVQWTDQQEEKIIERYMLQSEDVGRFHLNTPITLPNIVPDEFSLRISAPISVQTSDFLLSEAAVSYPSSERSEKSENEKWRYRIQSESYVDVENGKVWLKISYSQIRALLSDQKEGQIIIRTSIQDEKSGKHLMTLMFTLMTPPTKVSIQYRDRPSAILDGKFPLKLESEAKSMSLVAVLELKNHSLNRVEIKMPNLISDAILEQRFDESVANQLHCQVEHQVFISKKETGVQVYLFPEVPNLDRVWPLFFSERSSFLPVVLEADKSTQIAIYLEGDKSAEILETAINTRETKNFVKACHFGKDVECKVFGFIKMPNCKMIGGQINEIATIEVGKRELNPFLRFPNPPMLYLRNAHTTSTLDPERREVPFKSELIQFPVNLERE